MLNISFRKQAPSQYDQLSSDEDDFDLNEDHGFYWEKGEDPTEPTSDSESGEIHPTRTVRTYTKRLATDGILPQSMNYSPSDDEIDTLSPENSVHGSYVVTLELGPSELVSPLGDSTPTFFTGKLPSLEPPLHTPRRSGSSTNRGQKPSSGRTVRRRFSLDCKLQKTAMIQSLDQSDRVATKPRRRVSLDLKPRRRRSMDFSYRSDHNNLRGRTRTDSGVIMAPINGDSNHSGTRSMPNRTMRRGSLGGEKSNRTMRRGSLSSSGEKSNRTSIRRGSLGSEKSNRTHGSISRSQRRNQRNSNSDVKYLQMQFTSVEGTDGCCVIKRRSRSIKRSRSFDLNKASKPSPIGRTRSESGERFEAKLAQSENQESLEGKLANQRELKPPTSLRKQKMNEISAIYNQVHERHRRRYSAKQVDDSADEDE